MKVQELLEQLKKVDPLAEVMVVDTRSGVIDNCSASDETALVSGNEDAGAIINMLPGTVYYPIYTG